MSNQLFDIFLFLCCFYFIFNNDDYDDDKIRKIKNLRKLDRFFGPNNFGIVIVIIIIDLKLNK